MKRKITLIIDDEKMTEKLYYELISKSDRFWETKYEE
jgi:hypothetical protein